MDICMYIYKELFEDSKEKYQFLNGEYLFGGQKLRPANITFFNNYSNEVNGGYYRLDNIASVEKIPQPPAPEREGYNFAGWYTEAECITAWDFNEMKTLSKAEEFKLYAGWNIK